MEDPTPDQAAAPTSPTIHTPGPVPIVSSDRRQFIPPVFGIAALCFFLTFCNLTCGNQKLASVTGIELVTGTELSSPDIDMFEEEADELRNIDPNIWAIIAFGSALLGLITFVFRFRNENRIGTYSGITGFVSLIILQFTIQKMINNQTEELVEAEFQFGYWFALLAFAAAAYLCYQRFNQSPVVKVETVNTSPPVSNARTTSDEQGEMLP